MNPLLRAIEANRKHPPQISPNFIIEVEGENSDFLSYQCREVTVSLGSIEVEEIASGSLRFGLPRNATVSRLEMNFALDHEGKVMKYFKDWKSLVMSPNGLFGLPFGATGYVKRITISARENKTFEPSFEIRQMLVYPENLGQLNFSTKSQEAMELSITLCRFMQEHDRPE